MDIDVIKQYQREAFKGWTETVNVPDVLKRALERQLTDWEPLAAGVWFESNSRAYFDNEQLVQFMTFDAKGEEKEEGDEFYLFAIWTRESQSLEAKPVLAFTFIQNDDDTCSHLGAAAVAEDIDKFFAMLEFGCLGVGGVRLSQSANSFEISANPFSSFEEANAYSVGISERFDESELPPM